MKSKQIQEFKETEIGKIPKYWEIKQLKEIADVIDPHPSHRAPKEVQIGFPFAGIGDIDEDGTIDVKKARKISEEFVKQQEKAYEINKHSIGYGRVGTVGKIVKLRKKEFRYAISPTLAVINPNKKINEIFLNYAIQTNSFQNQVYARMTGTTRPALGIQELRKILVVYPPIIEQENIGKILDGITDKIQNLQNQNKILEDIIQTIFKSWFIDFDGQSEFFVSELGHIPKGWNIQKFSTITEILSGGTPKTNSLEYWNGDIKWVSIKDTEQTPFIINTEKKITKLGVLQSNAKILPIYTIIISARGTVGNCAILSEPMAINQSCYGLEGKNRVGHIFLFYLLKNTLHVFLANVHGTVFDTITRTTFDSIDVIVPPKEIINKFEQLAKPFFDIIMRNQIQISILSNLRNFLLPKLMSGEIRV